MSTIIQRLNCVETPSGFILTWDIAEGVVGASTTVYGLNGSRSFVIDSPLITTGRCVISPKNYGLITAFQLSVDTDNDGSETTDPISPQRMKKAERLLILDMRRRFDIAVKASPIGSYPSVILLRNIDGARCPNCGGENCSGRGGTAISDYCPICLGTGIKDPYYVYPKKELMHAINPKDDNDIMENPAVQRSHVVRAFQSVFDLQLRENDVFVSGTEVYRVLQQKISASVGNVPVYYNLTTMKYAPEDPRYQAFMTLANQVSND